MRRAWGAYAPRVEALRWVTGFYLLILGISFLLLPRPASGNLDSLWLRGAWSVAAGLALLWVSGTAPSRRVALPVQAVIAVTQLLFALDSLVNGFIHAAAQLAFLAIGLLIAAFIPPGERMAGPRADALGIAFGSAQAIQGLDYLLRPATAAALSAALGTSPAVIGGLLLVSGAAVVLSQLWLRAPAAFRWAAHISAGGLVVLFWAAVALRLDPVSWLVGAGTLLRGTSLAILPWLSERLPSLDGRALRPRLALALGTAAIVPLLIALPLALDRVDQLIIADAVGGQRGSALTVATLAAAAAALPSDQWPGLAGRLGQVVAPGTTITVVDAAGRLVSTTGPSRVEPGGDLSGQPAVRSALAMPDAGALLLPLPNGDQVVGAAPVAGTDWRVVVTRPRAAFLTPLAGMRQAAFSGTLLCLIVTCLGAWWLATRLAAPLAELTRAVDGVAAGKSGTAMPATTITEIARLGGAVQTMATTIAAQTAEREQLLAAERAARQEAEAAVQARDTFLSIAAHELKTPVTGIKGGVQLLLRRLERDGLDPDALARSLRIVDVATRRLARLVDDLLDVARIRTGHLALEPQPTDLVELVRTAVTRTEHSLEDRHRILFQATESMTVVALDEDAMDQVLTNLLDNAVKYSPMGGEVLVNVRQNGHGAVLTVTDHGIGLPRAETEAIFTPFARATNATASHLPGMGLGLYICRNIVERHGGRIWAESPGEGQGTTINVWLPPLPPLAEVAADG